MVMTNMGGVLLGEPGKPVGRGRPLDVVHPSIEEQVKLAQKHNREKYAKKNHSPVQLYMFQSDCEHSDPEEDEKFDGVNDLEDEWVERLGLTTENPYKIGSTEYWSYYDLLSKNRQRARSVIPLVAEYYRAQEEFDEQHSGQICLLSPMEVGCEYCDEDELEYGEGVTSPGCSLEADLREEYEEFWYGVSAEKKEYATL